MAGTREPALISVLERPAKAWAIACSEESRKALATFVRAAERTRAPGARYPVIAVIPSSRFITTWSEFRKTGMPFTDWPKRAINGPCPEGSRCSSVKLAAPTSAAGQGKGVSDLYGAALKSLTARSTGLQGVDAQIRRDDARLSTLGRLANVLDDVRSVAGTLAASGMTLAAQVDGRALSARITATGAAAGTHKVDVKQLAQAQRLATVAAPSATTPIGSGAPTVVKIETGGGGAAGTRTIRIGAPDNTLVINDPQSSSRHAEIAPDFNRTGYQITDLGSTNGTFVNEQRLTPNMPRPLNAGDVIRIGSLNFTYEASNSAGYEPTMLASAPDARFDDPAIIATIVFGALVGPVQILIEGDAPAEFGTRLEREIVSLLTAYLSRSRLARARKSTQITGSNRPFNSSSL